MCVCLLQQQQPCMLSETGCRGLQHCQRVSLWLSAAAPNSQQVMPTLPSHNWCVCRRLPVCCPLSTQPHAGVDANDQGAGAWQCSSNHPRARHAAPEGSAGCARVGFSCQLIGVAAKNDVVGSTINQLIKHACYSVLLLCVVFVLSWV